MEAYFLFDFLSAEESLSWTDKKEKESANIRLLHNEADRKRE